MEDPRWLNADATARYISVRASALNRLVKKGSIPKPSYRLGPRSPRWDRHALDAAFDGGAASTDPGMAVAALVKGITSRKSRAKNARRRNGSRV